MKFNRRVTERKKAKAEFTNAVGSTRVPRVHFGVPPNCVGVRSTVPGRTNDGNQHPLPVSGAAPETTRGTRVLPTGFHMFPPIGAEFNLE